MLIIVATIFCISDPTGTSLCFISSFKVSNILQGDLSPNGALLWLGFFRILLGVGVGGDYPMSASVTSDRTYIRKRGTMLAYIFSNQGWGSFVGSLATIIVLLAYKHVMNDEKKTSKVDGGPFDVILYSGWW